MWLRLINLNFMTINLRKKCSKEWLKETKLNRKPRPSKRAKAGRSSSQQKRLQVSLLKSSSRQAHWHLRTALYQHKPKNSSSRVSSRYKNQSKSKFMRRKNKNLSSQTRSKSKRGERREKRNWSSNKARLRLSKKLDFIILVSFKCNL